MKSMLNKAEKTLSFLMALIMICAMKPGLEAGADDRTEIPEQWFDDALFIGDSITGALGNYALFNGGLGKAQVVRANGLACHNIVENTQGVLYKGKMCSIGEVAELSGAAKLFLLLVMNDLGVPMDELRECWKTMVADIRERCPEMEIYIQSGTPVRTDIGRFSMQNIREYNDMLRDICEETGCAFVEIQEGLTDETGYMKKEFYADNEHINNKGCVVWMENLKNPASYSIPPVLGGAS